MSIINSLKTFSKKAFNVEPKGSNIDEVLDDMASKVTPGSGGSGSEPIPILKATVIDDGKVDAVGLPLPTVTVTDINEETTYHESTEMMSLVYDLEREKMKENIYVQVDDQVGTSNKFLPLTNVNVLSGQPVIEFEDTFTKIVATTNGFEYENVFNDIRRDIGTLFEKVGNSQ